MPLRFHKPGSAEAFFRIGQHNTVVMYVLVTILITTLAPKATAQPFPDNLETIYSSIKAQEAKFPLPNTTETVTVGVLDLGSIDEGEIKFIFSIPYRSEGRVFQPNYNYDPRDDLSRGTFVPKRKGLITITNILHLNLRFALVNWVRLPNSKVTITVGSQSKTVDPGTTEIVFSDITEIEPPISIGVRGAKNTRNVGIGHLTVVGLEPIKIDWRTIGAGAITIPLLPVAIIYAPVVDKRKNNKASSEISKMIANSTEISFKTKNSQTHPVASSFQNAEDLRQIMKNLGTALGKSPNEYAKGFGEALVTISSLMGSSRASIANAFSATSQSTLKVSNSTTVSQKTDAKQGGPGVGDLFSYYYNVKVVWYSENGKMRLAVLGYDGIVHTTAGRLKATLKELESKPTGYKDLTLKIDAIAIAELLKLNPLTKDPSADLPLPRFKPIDAGVIVVAGGGERKFTLSSKIEKEERQTSTTTITRIEDNSKGLLAFIGLGVTESEEIQLQIEQSSSLQKNSSETVTQEYSFWGDPEGSYTTKVYLDVVFGTFAFRDLTNMNKDAVVSGILLDRSNNPLPNTVVKATINNQTFITRTSGSGKFKIHLPNINHGHLKLSCRSAGAQVEFKGSSIENVRLKIL